MNNKERRSFYYKNKNNKTKKNYKNKGIINTFEKEITLFFLDMLISIKLFHWKTYSYAIHKATDELYSKINEHMDKFVEVLLGKIGNRIDLKNVKSLPIYDISNPDSFKEKINGYKSYLVGLTNNKTMNLMSNVDLFTIRDEILGDLNQFLYLLTFQ